MKRQVAGVKHPAKGAEAVATGDQQSVFPDDERVIRASRQAWARLGAHLLRWRQGELGYRYRPEFEYTSNINIRMISDIENGHPRAHDTWPAGTLETIARGYHVTYDSMIAVLHDHRAHLERGQHSPQHDGVTPALPPRAGPQPPSWMTSDTRDALSPYAVPVFERLVAAGHPGPDGDLDATGPDLFGPGTADAANWDLWAQQGFPPVYRVWLTAYVRRHCDPMRNGAAS